MTRNADKSQSSSKDSRWRVLESRRSARVFQNGTLLSWTLKEPGPTHRLFDVLAACLQALGRGDKVAALGFAAGGVVPPLRGMMGTHSIHGVDTEDAGYRLFRSAVRNPGDVSFQRADAVQWLRRRRAPFDVILEDLSVPEGQDIVKPEISSSLLPELAQSRLAERGVYIANFFPPFRPSWKEIARRVARPYPAAHWIGLHGYYNRILVAGNYSWSAREITFRLLCALDAIRSRQADRFFVRSISSGRQKKE